MVTANDRKKQALSLKLFIKYANHEIVTTWHSELVPNLNGRWVYP